MFKKFVTTCNEYSNKQFGKPTKAPKINWHNFYNKIKVPKYLSKNKNVTIIVTYRQYILY